MEMELCDDYAGYEVRYPEPVKAKPEKKRFDLDRFSEMFKKVFPSAVDKELPHLKELYILNYGTEETIFAAISYEEHFITAIKYIPTSDTDGLFKIKLDGHWFPANEDDWNDDTKKKLYFILDKVINEEIGF